MSEQAERPILLVCTVGGSPQPIATALRLLRPDVVWFLVSDDKTGESSRSQVESREIDYDKRLKTRGLGLTFAEGCPAGTKIFAIPADDPDAAYKVCRTQLAEARRRYPDHRLIADYTGGTKSMTGALLMAAFAQPGVEVQFMAGERSDLVQVKSGSERPQRMAADFIMAERDFAAAEQAVKGYDYAAALLLLDDLHTRLKPASGAPPEDSYNRLKNARAWATVMANWDAFKHGRVVGMVRRAHVRAAWLGIVLESSGHLHPLLALGEREKGAPGWDLCADLWLNALRRGERARYDDAVARLYRLVEAAAQAWLWEKYKLRSGTIPFSKLPDRMKIDQDQNDECAKLGLNRTVEFLWYCDPHDRFAAAYAGECAGEDRLQGPPWLSQRNLSILAHGFESVSKGVWEDARDWTKANVMPLYQHIDIPQLPREIPSLQNVAV